MAYLVATMKKMKAENLVGIGNHNQRLTNNHSNKEIDVERSHLNYDLDNRTENYKKDIEQFINENKSTSRAIRKDAVLINEWIITSDSKFFENLTADETKDFFQTAHDYFANRFGEENIRYATVHLDETTPHMHMGIVPFTPDKRLSAKTVFNRKTLLEIQENLPKALKEKGFEIDRGNKDSERKKLTVPEYKKMKNEIKKIEIKRDELEKELLVTFEKNKFFMEEKKETEIELEKNKQELHSFLSEKTEIEEKIIKKKEELNDLIIKTSEDYLVTDDIEFKKIPLSNNVILKVDDFEELQSGYKFKEYFSRGIKRLEERELDIDQYLAKVQSAESRVNSKIVAIEQREKNNENQIGQLKKEIHNLEWANQDLKNKNSALQKKLNRFEVALEKTLNMLPVPVVEQFKKVFEKVLKIGLDIGIGDRER